LIACIMVLLMQPPSPQYLAPSRWRDPYQTDSSRDGTGTGVAQSVAQKKSPARTQLVFTVSAKQNLEQMQSQERAVECMEVSKLML